ncbi:MAG: gamma-glutamyltransferase family protein [Pseudophaeobacter sp. bin_em_oilr2.035]|uniref:Gamma-glutamyltransferase family protein n=1 Tax=Phaeobacter gallaeciensis TaxID=60890 RepID=A0ABD4XC41_9RHOB|nr:gamma-glutamyltransferase family protein [Phaeobacter gallaeciensis]MDF1772997.1 gamma-glutamyltransferase family protein [Pseudophaeobacter sp. bin_em_oilr2.035]MDE4145596.1 gamma-glutamyltransferase family protein [Phaeobacter gallaeciensis]MDE4158267.1 gamma-glutamyltransferase family protein [Phaeobacter gallaeciensis]MDE4162446.1 gamma-glutamyltransferase family protein [Phaeobacter gallaeciensis]MDE4166672.1 gamma-glutamyltransferase family protein [Phaeobacter gallaeciensis]
MSDFTTRPEIRGTFGVATSTHWIASTVGMSILEKGGNAFDAAVATALVLQVVEPHLNGPAGDMPAIFHKAETGETKVVCAQGVAPKAATIEAYTEQGLTLIPGSGLLATVVPGAFDGWMMMLRDHGTMSLREVLEPVIGYARDGHPVLPRVANTIAGLQEFFETEWPTSAAVWAPGGEAPKPNALFKNPDLARTYERLAEAGEAAGEDRVAQIDAARAEWREGFVAEAIFDYLKDAHVMDVSDEKHSAVLAPDDLKDWRATYEDTLSYEYEGWTVHKTHAWSQGPVLLQGLAILKGFDLGAMDPFGAEFVHTVTEAMKLAYADREAYYGDPAQSEIPMEYLLSEEYNAERRKLITDKASTEQRPGRVPGFEHLADAYIERAARDFNVGQVAAQEPTMSHLTEKRGDTVHLDVIDRWGNMVAATPSGGWLQSSPVIPGLGFPLNSRAQMFWLEDGLPTSLAPGRRPRTTLTPSYAEKDGVQMVFGTPGGDQQDQWQLIWFLRFVHFGMELQQCMDAPLFHSMHFQGSFFPREVRTAEMMVEPNFGEAVIADLRARGHNVVVADPWTVGRLTAALREPDGMLRAAATPRLMQAYAVGR